MQKVSYKHLLILCIVASGQFCASALASELIRQRLGFSPGLREYETELVRLALEASSISADDFRLNSVYNESSIERILTEVNRGDAIHVTINTFTADKKLYPQVGSFELPESRNLLGFRQFIIRSSDRELFASIKTSRDFYKLKPGQAQEWSDVAIYKAAGFQIILSINYGQLFPMLSKNRFDYLPLGLLEMEQSFSVVKDRYPDLTTIDGIYIYYPLKLYVHYNKNDNSRAERIGDGLTKIFSNGVEEELFNNQFGDKFKTVDREKSKIFILDNPAYSAAENKRISELFTTYHHFEKNAVWISQEQSSN